MGSFAYIFLYIIYIFIFFSSLCFRVIFCENDSIYQLWQPVTEFDEDNATPAGYEDNVELGTSVSTYIAQGYLGDGTIPVFGKYTRETDKCEVDLGGRVIEMDKERCNYLTYPLGTLTWVPTTSETLPSSKRMVKAGLKRYICRANEYEGALIIGTMDIRAQKCMTGFDGQERLHEEFDILYVNMLGYQLFKRAAVAQWIG